MNILKTSIAFVIICFVAACQSTGEKMAEAGHDPLTAAGINELLVGNSLYQKGDTWEWVGYYQEGTLKGKAWGSWGEEFAEATWETTADNQYCRQWDNDWGDGQRACFKLYDLGEDIVFEHVSGPKPGGDDTMKFSEGNAYGL